jgi:hypothetical protein
MTNKIIEIAVGVIALILIFTFLLPLLGGVILVVAKIALVLIAIIWLLRLGGIINL